MNVVTCAVLLIALFALLSGVSADSVTCKGKCIVDQYAADGAVSRSEAANVKCRILWEGGKNARCAIEQIIPWRPDQQLLNWASPCAIRCEGANAHYCTKKNSNGNVVCEG
jgi:hypothetical protein